MKSEESSAQYTIRSIPREVDRALRQRAARQKQSLNRVIVEVLTEATTGLSRKIDLSDVTGGWTPDPAFDEILSSQRQVNRNRWK
jgi:hypothetical protein